MPEIVREGPEDLADLIEERTGISWERTRDSLPGMTTGQLVELMAELDACVNRDVAIEIARRKDAVFHLRKLLQDGGRWQEGPDTSHWAPIHAIFILGLVRGREALQLLLDVIRFRSEELGDWLTENVPAILHSFGPAALPALRDFTADGTLTTASRAAAIDAMFAFAVKEPGCREVVIAAFRATLDGPEEPFLALMAAKGLVHLDKSLLGEVLAAYADGRLSAFYMNEEEMKRFAERAYGDELEADLSRITRDPLDHFSREISLELREYDRKWEEWSGLPGKRPDVMEPVNEMAEARDAEGAVPEKEQVRENGPGPGPADPRQGSKGPARNAPCPCGSGKKYKRCCMPRPGRG